MLRVVTVAALFISASSGAFAQPAGTEIAKRTVTVTALIMAIDYTTRSVTLRSAEGDEETLTVGPAVTRFDQLKAGQTIKATYQESLVVQVRKPGATPPATTDSLTASRAAQAPGGEIGAVKTATVTVKAIDLEVPSITITTTDGRTTTRKIADKKNLEGVKTGDTIDITYTVSLMVNVETAK